MRAVEEALHAIDLSKTSIKHNYIYSYELERCFWRAVIIGYYFYLKYNRILIFTCSPAYLKWMCSDGLRKLSKFDERSDNFHRAVKRYIS